MNYRIEPWPHQVAALDAARGRDFFALFMEMGTGKTATAINMVREWAAEHRRVPRTLIVTPLAVCESWRREVAAHAGTAINAATVVLGGSQKKRIETVCADNGKRIYVTNPESLSMPNLCAAFESARFDCLIVDESHKFKSPKAKRTKSLHKLADQIKWKRILTGTPILNSPLDVWAQLRILSPEIVGQSQYKWALQFFRDINAHKQGKPTYFPEFVPRENYEEEFNELLRAHSFQVKKRDVLKNLPPLTKQIRYCSLTTEQLKVYAPLAKGLRADLQQGKISTTNALERLLRLQQITAGVVQPSEGEPYVVKNSKLAELVDLLEEIPPEEKLIVWSNFVPTYQILRAALKEAGRESVTITGGQTAKERTAAVDAFNADPKITACVANPAAGGVGIGLQAASYMIYFSKGFSLEQDAQSEARAHRGGSEIHQKITRIDLICEKTIDVEVHYALENKLSRAELLLSLKK